MYDEVDGMFLLGLLTGAIEPVDEDSAIFHDPRRKVSKYVRFIPTRQGDAYKITVVLN